MTIEREAKPIGLILSDAQRRALATRLMVQPPRSLADIAEFQRYSRSVERISGFPSDVLTTLESIYLLADQGNVVAQGLYMSECKRLGIDFGRRFGV